MLSSGNPPALAIEIAMKQDAELGGTQRRNEISYTESIEHERVSQELACEAMQILEAIRNRLHNRTQ